MKLLCVALPGLAIALALVATTAAAETITIGVEASADGVQVTYSEDVPANAGVGSLWVDSTGVHCAGQGQVQGAVYRYTCF